MDQESNGLRVELIQPFFIYRSWILVVSALFAVVLVLIKLFSPTQYHAIIVVAPTNSGSQLSNQLGQLSGLASIAGVQLGSGDDVPDFDKFMYLVSSSELAQWQLRHHNILGLLYDDWDSKANNWAAPSNPVEFVKSILRGGKVPEASEIQDLYADHLSVHDVSANAAKPSITTGPSMMMLTYTDEDPNKAKQILTAIVADSNEILREKAALRADAQAKYLIGELKKVSVNTYRDTLEKFLAQQEQTLMLTNSHVAFAADSVSPLESVTEKVPKRTALLAMLAAAVGFSFSYFFAIVRYNLKRPESAAGAQERMRPLPVFPVVRSWVLAYRRPRSKPV